MLLEQQDWFEDDIRFLRQVLQPGQQGIDIGATFGPITGSTESQVNPSTRWVQAGRSVTKTSDNLSR